MEQIEGDNWHTVFSGDAKPFARTHIQTNVVLKIMMYIEDLVVLAESFIRGKDFYSEFFSPSSDDLGPVIKEFFDKVNSFSNCEILKLMYWIDMPSVLTEVRLKEPVKKIQEYHISKVRKLLKECGDFGISNHPLSKRFKHGGMPVISPSIQVAPRTGPLAIFDSFSIISKGNNPLKDIHIIPFSAGIFERYKQLVAKIQETILDMVDNRIICIQRQIGGVFLRNIRNTL